MRRLNISLTDEQYRRLVDLVAERTKRKGRYVSIAAIIREIIDKYLKAEKEVVQG